MVYLESSRGEEGNGEIRSSFGPKRMQHARARRREEEGREPLVWTLKLELKEEGTYVGFCLSRVESGPH